MNLDDLIEKASKRAGELERDPPAWLYVLIFLAILLGMQVLKASF